MLEGDESLNSNEGCDATLARNKRRRIETRDDNGVTLDQHAEHAEQAERELKEAREFIAQIREPLLYYLGTTDPELVRDQLKDWAERLDKIPMTARLFYRYRFELVPCRQPGALCGQCKRKLRTGELVYKHRDERGRMRKRLCSVDCAQTWELPLLERDAGHRST